MRVQALVGTRADIVGPETAASDVVRVMIEREVGAVAVVDSSGLVGICTDRDLARALAAGSVADTPVVEIMTEAPDTVSPDVSVSDAAAWMLETGYRHLPVVHAGELLGIVDIRDVLWALIDA